MTPDREPGESGAHEAPGDSTRSDDAKDEPSRAARPMSGAQDAIVGWARAVVMGVRDTAQDVLHEGRSGAREKRSQMWDRFDRKTKGRRTRE